VKLNDKNNKNCSKIKAAQMKFLRNVKGLTIFNTIQLKIYIVADHFWYSCLLGLLVSVTDGSWPCSVSLICQYMFRNQWW